MTTSNRYGIRVLSIIINLTLGLTAAGGLGLILSGCGDDNGTAETAGTAEPAAVPPRKTDVIVFIRDGEVWAVNPNNGAERKLTSDSTKKIWPRVSPDGTQVLYQEVMGDGATTAGIYRVSLMGGDVPELINPIGAYPAWSTDGKSIACVVKNPAPDNQQTDDIAVVDAGNPESGATVLTDHKQVIDSGGPLSVQNLRYSPDGKYIYFMRGRRSDSRWLARVEVATRAEDDVTAPPAAMPGALADGGFSLFNVSQMEGRRALVARGDLTSGDFQQNHRLYIRFLEPELEDSMIEETAGSINPTLKPDNTRFAYENNGVIYRHNLAGGPGIEKITVGGMPDWGMSAVGPGFDTDGDDTGTTGTTATGTGGGSGTTGPTDCGGAGLTGTEYIRNGDFESGLSGWATVDIRKKGSNRVQTADDPECGKVLTFTRSGSQNDGGLSGVEQTIDVSRSGHAVLRLRMVAAIEEQDLPGDGWYDGETPVFVTIDYVSAGGAAKTWTHGLLAKGEINYPQRDQLIPMGGWYQWDSPELLAALPDLDRITRITIGGSGWDFSSRIGLISLRGQ